MVIVFGNLIPINFCSAARNAGKKTAIDLGTKVEAAIEIKSSSCSEKYAACMDAGCVIDNESGGRCQCSNKIKDLNAEFAKLRKKDSQTSALATFGKDIVEMGEYEDELLGIGSDAEDGEEMDFISSGSVGDKLRATMHDLCMEKLPECKSQLKLITNMYSQKIKSDCAAFENALAVQNQESKERRADAKKAVRGAALEQYQASNKYDLGQCVVEFGKCMQDTAECGEDWTGCVGRLGIDKMYTDSTKQVSVVGANSSVMIAKSTMEILESKKIICESVTKQCTSVKDHVWDAFLKNAIADIKVAESKAESNARTSCLTNISNCFLNACKDNIDDKNPDSYDLCLTRPESMKNLCKVEMEPCLNATGGSYDKPEKSTLWPSVLAKLAAMRVDSCTTELKDCLQSEDRCGKDYSQCIGLDTEDIISICPKDKLIACYTKYGDKSETVRETLERIAQGVLLNVDNELLTACENAVTDAMLKYCGDTYTCNDLFDDDLGTHSLSLRFCIQDGSGYKNCKSSVDLITDIELGKTTRDINDNQILHDRQKFIGIIGGEIAWEHVKVNKDINGIEDLTTYLNELKNDQKQDELTIKTIQSELGSINERIQQTMDMIESDSRVSYCISGRELPGLNNDDVFKKFTNKKNNPRFPNLTKKYRTSIANAAVSKVRNNYYRKYDELHDNLVIGEYKIASRMAEIDGINSKQYMMDAARNACLVLGQGRQMYVVPVDVDAGRTFESGTENAGLTAWYTQKEDLYQRTVKTTFDNHTGNCQKCIQETLCDVVWNMGFVCLKWGETKEKCNDIQFLDND